MAETVHSILDEVGDSIAALVGEAGRLTVPVNGLDTALQEVTVSRGGFVVPDLSRSGYHDTLWRNAMQAKYPGPGEAESADESIHAQYSPGMIVVKHCVAAAGQRDRRVEENFTPIQFDWQASRAYVFGLGEEHGLPGIVMAAYEVVKDEESDLTVACLGWEHTRQPIGLQAAVTLRTLFECVQTVRNDRIQALSSSTVQ